MLLFKPNRSLGCLLDCFCTDCSPLVRLAHPGSSCLQHNQKPQKQYLKLSYFNQTATFLLSVKPPSMYFNSLHKQYWQKYLWQYIFGKKQKSNLACVTKQVPSHSGTWLLSVGCGQAVWAREAFLAYTFLAQQLPTLPEMGVWEVDRESPLKDPDLLEIYYHSPQRTPRERGKDTLECGVRHPAPPKQWPHKNLL